MKQSMVWDYEQSKNQCDNIILHKLLARLGLIRHRNRMLLPRIVNLIWNYKPY